MQKINIHIKIDDFTKNFILLAFYSIFKIVNQFKIDRVNFFQIVYVKNIPLNF